MSIVFQSYFILDFIKPCSEEQIDVLFVTVDTKFVFVR